MQRRSLQAFQISAALVISLFTSSKVFAQSVTFSDDKGNTFSCELTTNNKIKVAISNAQIGKFVYLDQFIKAVKRQASALKGAKLQKKKRQINLFKHFLAILTNDCTSRLGLGTGSSVPVLPIDSPPAGGDPLTQGIFTALFQENCDNPFSSGFAHEVLYCRYYYKSFIFGADGSYMEAIPPSGEIDNFSCKAHPYNATCGTWSRSADGNSVNITWPSGATFSRSIPTLKNGFEYGMVSSTYIHLVPQRAAITPGHFVQQLFTTGSTGSYNRYFVFNENNTFETKQFSSVRIPNDLFGLYQPFEEPVRPITAYGNSNTVSGTYLLQGSTMYLQFTGADGLVTILSSLLSVDPNSSAPQMVFVGGIGFLNKPS